MAERHELLAQAQAAPEGTPRSKLENYCGAIFELRRKRWTYEKIAKWLKTNGVEIVPSSVFRFCRTHSSPAQIKSAASAPPPPVESPSPPTGKRKYRFNLDV